MARQLFELASPHTSTPQPLTTAGCPNSEFRFSDPVRSASASFDNSLADWLAERSNEVAEGMVGDTRTISSPIRHLPNLPAWVAHE